MPIVKFRAYDPALVPRRTRLEIPGWAGEDEPRADGSREQPWHCIPFTEAARVGLELPFPHEKEFRIGERNGGPSFDDAEASGDVVEASGDASGDAGQIPPFRDFGGAYYTYQLLLDLKVEDGWALRVDTHPSFYTDRTGTVPIAVPAVLRHWWPMINFVVFKTPGHGQTHVFRPGKPFLQITIVRIDHKIELVAMPEEEAAERELMAQRLHASRATLGADSQWSSATDTVFDGTYRRLYGAAKASGMA